MTSQRGWMGGATLIVVLAAFGAWAVRPLDVERELDDAEARVRARLPVPVPVSSEVERSASARTPDAWSACATRCPDPVDAACALDCALAVIASSPDDPKAWTVARFNAMRMDDQELYRDLLQAGRRMAPGSPASTEVEVSRAWGRWLAARAPEVQQRGLELLVSADLHLGPAGAALGISACGVRGPDFVVCAP